MGNHFAACSTVIATQPVTTQTICPQGWRLPTSTSGGGEFGAMRDAVGGNVATFTATWLGVYSGYYGGVLADQSNTGTGYYWSSVKTNNNGANSVNLNNSSFLPGNAGIQYGLAVRCVAN
jgi:uncharacterized protein (TIGR02145 family)